MATISAVELHSPIWNTLYTLLLTRYPWFFVAVALVTFLVDEHGMTDDEKLLLISMGMLPWIIGKLILGPMIDRIQFRSMGRRRPWVLISQLGMAVTIAAFLLIEDLLRTCKCLASFSNSQHLCCIAGQALMLWLLKSFLEGKFVGKRSHVCSERIRSHVWFLVLGSILLDSGFQAALLCAFQSSS